MPKKPEVEIIQHVLPAPDDDGVYDGRPTRYVRRLSQSGKDGPVAYFVGQSNEDVMVDQLKEECPVQTKALQILEKNPEKLNLALSKLPDRLVEDVLTNEFDPEQYVLHLLAQAALHQDFSPAIVSTTVEIDEDSPASLLASFDAIEAQLRKMVDNQQAQTKQDQEHGQASPSTLRNGKRNWHNLPIDKQPYTDGDDE